MGQPEIHTFELSESFADETFLSKDEQRRLKSLAYTGGRRKEWILGRVAIHRALEEDFPGERFEIGSTPRGAPCVNGTTRLNVSLSHDGDFFGVALTEGRREVGMDVCRISHSSRLTRILQRLALDLPNLPPSLIWASFEAVLKIHKRGITALLDADLTINPQGDSLFVTGIGTADQVFYRKQPEYFVAWCCSEAECTS